MKPGISRHLPNFLTCMNLFSGCLAVVFIFRDDTPVFACFVAASLIFDFLDGFAARALKANSLIGKELDSLADMVSFGVVPGAMMYHLFLKSVPLNLWTDTWWAGAITFIPFVITVFSGLRLALFNIDTRQSVSFIGMPTPAVTIFTTGIALILYDDRYHLTPIILNSYILAGLCLVLSFMLISELPLLSLKFRSISWRSNRAQYILVILSVACGGFMGFTGIPLIIILYLILSLLNNRFHLNSETLPVK